MIVRWLARSALQTFRVSRKIAGFSLVFAAFCGPALARAPAKGPEIDPGTATSAVALFLGGVLLLTDRFRRK
jgi:hypothetical protein